MILIARNKKGLKMKTSPDRFEKKEESRQEEQKDPTTRRGWTTPTFERVSLNDALDNPGAGTDFNGRAS